MFNSFNSLFSKVFLNNYQKLSKPKTFEKLAKHDQTEQLDQRAGPEQPNQGDEENLFETFHHFPHIEARAVKTRSAGLSVTKKHWKHKKNPLDWAAGHQKSPKPSKR